MTKPKQPIVGAGHETAAPRGHVGAVDQHLGRRIRARRMMIRLSPRQLARLIGVTEPQSRRYERGTDRIEAARLHLIAEALAVPLSWFFMGLSTDSRTGTPGDGERHRDSFDQMARVTAGQRGHN